MTYKILIVEDDPVIARGLQDALEPWGYEVRAVRDFSDVTGEFLAFSPHLTIMDVSLPRRNGFYWCQEIRRHSSAPVMFLSSKSEDVNVITAMHVGGDDYMAKPVSPDVVLAKVGAMLRRCYDFTESREMAGWLIDGDALTLTRGNDTVELTRNEMRIFSLLNDHRGKAVSRDRIMLALWNSDEFVDDNTLTVNVNRLRKKLDGTGIRVETVKGQGYRLAEG